MSNKSQLNKNTDLPSDLYTVINDLPQDKKNIIIKALTIRQHHFSGPLPDGESIKIYSEVIPDGGDRLMKTVEKQLEHRINLEKQGLKRSFNQSAIGQWMAFTIAVIFGLIAWDLAKSGHELTAQILGAFDLVALVTVFITGKTAKNKKS